MPGRPPLVFFQHLMGNYVRVQVLTNAGALDRDKELAVVGQLTDIIAAAAGDLTLAGRTWVLLTEAPEGGWGLARHANTNAELVSAACAQVADLARTGRHIAVIPPRPP
jgi:phenylpyruvate tautomerase PptA (4-oxalocrotonate tautomerase family)